MAGGGGGGGSVTAAWTLRNELAVRSEEQPLASKHLGKVWHRNRWGKGVQQACSYRAPLPLHFGQDTNSFTPRKVK